MVLILLQLYIFYTRCALRVTRRMMTAALLQQLWHCTNKEKSSVNCADHLIYSLIMDQAQKTVAIKNTLQVRSRPDFR